MKPEGALHVKEVRGMDISMSSTAIGDLIGDLQRRGVRGEVYEIKVPPGLVFNALREVKSVNRANIGFFIKVTVAWEYEGWDEWSLRCGDVEVWSPGV